MNIALILCPYWSRETPPLSLALLSSSLRKNGNTVSLFDFNNFFYHNCKDEFRKFWKKENDKIWENKKFIFKFINENRKLFEYCIDEIISSDISIVGFSVYRPNQFMSLEFARRIKEKNKNKTIIFGGPECINKINVDFFIKDDAVDIVVKGEGEEVLLEIVECFKKNIPINKCRGILFKSGGKIFDTGDFMPIKNLNCLSFSDFSDFNLAEYEHSNTLPIFFSRGCFQNCVFCTGKSFWKTFRCRKGENVFNEINYQMDKFNNLNFFIFYDSLLNGNIKALSDFCDLMIEKYSNNNCKVRWSGNAIVRPEMNSELLKKMSKAGCFCLTYGIECGSQKILDTMKKKFNINDADYVIKQTKKAGIRTVVNFMFGFPTETKKDFSESLRFLERNANYIDEVNPSDSCCSIEKGSYLFENSQEFNVSFPVKHSFYWKTNDGKNTFPERLRRFEIFCDLALSLGIKLGSGYKRIKEFKNDYLEDYYNTRQNNQKIKDIKQKTPKIINNIKKKTNFKIAIVLTPGWGRQSPSYSLALLAGILRSRHFKVNTFDINNGLYHRHEKGSKERQLWRWEQSTFWQNKKLVEKYIKENDRLINSEVDKIISSGAKVIGFSIYYSTKLMSIEFAKRIKQKDKNKIIIFGGTECQRKLNWQELINEEVVDAVFLDDADQSLPDFLNIIEQEGKFRYCSGIVYKKDGKVVDCGDRPTVPLDSLPFVDFSDFDFNSYESPDTIKIAFSRGCTERCVYCSARGVWRKFRTMSGDRIFRELQYQADFYKKRMGKHSYGQIMFLDSLVNANMKVFKDWVSKWAEARKNKTNSLFDLNWCAQIIIRKEMTEDILEKVLESGCIELNYGIESGSDKILKDMKKRYDSKIAEKVVRAINKTGITTKANFMFGFPTETEEDFKETLKFIGRNGKYMSLIYPSRTFCAIERFSYLDENKAEFGIIFRPCEHHLFWESQEGRNNYLVRLDRYLRFCKEVSKLKHQPLITGVQDIERDKYLSIAEYYKYKKDYQKALGSYKNYLRLGGVEDSVIEEIKLCKEKIRLSKKTYIANADIKLENKKISTPDCFIFTITDKCNLKCRHCNIWKKSNDEELSVDEWKLIVKKIYKWVGKFDLIISGGEPLLKRGLMDLISFCSRYGITTTISTNGSLLDVEKNRIINSGLNFLSVSLDSLSGMIDWTRNKKGLNEKILIGIEELLNNKKHPSIEIGSLLMKQNADEIVHIIDWAKSKNIRFILNPLLEELGKDKGESNWYKNSILWPDSNKAVKVIDKIIYKKRTGFNNIVNPISQLEAIKYYYVNPHIRSTQYICSVGERNFGIGPNGNVHFCPVTGDIDNILKKQPENIWYSEKSREARLKIKKCNMSCYILGCYFK